MTKRTEVAHFGGVNSPTEDPGPIPAGPAPVPAETLQMTPRETGADAASRATRLKVAPSAEPSFETSHLFHVQDTIERVVHLADEILDRYEEIDAIGARIRQALEDNVGYFRSLPSTPPNPAELVAMRRKARDRKLILC